MSAEINASIVELVKNEKAFQNSFAQNLKKTPVVSKNHVFDSKQTVITVGPKNTRFPFDTEEHIYALSDVNAECLKAQGVKLKPSMIT